MYEEFKLWSSAGYNKGDQRKLGEAVDTAVGQEETEMDQQVSGAAETVRGEHQADLQELATVWLQVM